MPKSFIAYMFISYIAMFGAVYLMVQCIEILEDYLYERKLIKHLTRIEEKVDKLPGANKE